ncbi:MAG TPA: zinc ribbon domain-containing protein [Dehalococcoidia bacterium]|nr:zinc ribbon domain-containing protein [Dehalococcoidia bacterium]
MPIYEYRCDDCQRVTEAFHRDLNKAKKPNCEHCDSVQTTRVISRFATPKTEAQVMEQYGVPDPGAGPDAYKDPRQIGRWAEKRFEDMGVEMPAEAKQMIDAAREGDLPDPVKDL